MYTRPETPRSVGGVLDDGIKLYRASFPRCWPIALCMYVVIAIVMVLVISQHPALSGGSRDPVAMLAALRSPGVWGAYLVALLAALLFYPAMIASIDAVAADRPLSFGEALQRGASLMMRMLGVWLLLMLVLVGSGVVAAIVVPLAQGTGVRSPLIPLLVAIVVVALVCFFLGRLFLAGVALVIDDAGAMRSLKLSWAVTRGHWWRATTVYAVAVTILIGFYVISAALKLLVLSLAGTGMLAGVIEQIVTVGLGTIVASFQVSILISLYYDLKLRSEGDDLAARVDALAAR